MIKRLEGRKFMIKLLKSNIISMYLIILLTLTGCVNNTKNINKLDLKKYGINDSSYVILKITYNELIEQNNNIDGLVLVVKEGCNYCSPFIQRIVDICKDNSKVANKLYALESDELTMEQKKYLAEKYMLTSVPTIMVFENGNLKSIEVGNIDDETLEKIIIK